MKGMKFSHIIDGECVAYDYGNRYCRQTAGGQERLVIGPTEGHVDLMLDLAMELANHPTFVLWVLLVPLSKTAEACRYQSRPFETHLELAQFMTSFRGYFESHGGQHVWIGSTENEGLVIYDQ